MLSLKTNQHLKRADHIKTWSTNAYISQTHTHTTISLALLPLQSAAVDSYPNEASGHC